MLRVDFNSLPQNQKFHMINPAIDRKCSSSEHRPDIKQDSEIEPWVRLGECLVRHGLGNRACGGKTLRDWIVFLKDESIHHLQRTMAVSIITGLAGDYVREKMGNGFETLSIEFKAMQLPPDDDNDAS